MVTDVRVLALKLNCKYDEVLADLSICNKIIKLI
jgi:hypothetical protein